MAAAQPPARALIGILQNITSEHFRSVIRTGSMSTYLAMRSCAAALGLLSEHRSAIVPRMFLTVLEEIEGCWLHSWQFYWLHRFFPAKNC